MSGLEAFWAHIEQQLTDLKSAKSADDVFAICPPVPGYAEPNAEGFFSGSGGDGDVADSLESAGWRMAIYKAPYYWVMEAPNKDKVTYVEGDLYRGNTIPPLGR